MTYPRMLHKSFHITGLCLVDFITAVCQHNNRRLSQVGHVPSSWKCHAVASNCMAFFCWHDLGARE